MKKVVKLLSLPLALAILLTACGSGDYQNGYWGGREDVPFVTALEIGFRSAQAERNCPCTMSFKKGWDGPQTPDTDILKSKQYAFTAQGRVDIFEPHEGTTIEDVYETAFILYLIYDKSTKQVSAAGGYMDRGMDDYVGAIDAETATMFVQSYYTYYDAYENKKNTSG